LLVSSDAEKKNQNNFSFIGLADTGGQMPVTYKIDPSKNLTSFVVYGEISAEDILSAIRPIYENPDLLPTLNVLWDYREGVPDPLIRDEDIEKIASYLSNHATKRAGGKTAIVARADLEFDISKKYEFFTRLKGLSITVEVFRSLGEAMLWLDERD